MVHITCDLCGKDLSAENGLRYIVKMEIYASHDPSTITEADLDDDHLEAISEILREAEDDGTTLDAVAPAYQKVRFDICPACHKKFSRDPLGKETAQSFNFSEN